MHWEYRIIGLVVIFLILKITAIPTPFPLKNWRCGASLILGLSCLFLGWDGEDSKDTNKPRYSLKFEWLQSAIPPNKTEFTYFRVKL
jgi:hypothetical protein